MKTTEFIDKFHPCRDALEYLSQYDEMAEAWDNCQRADWMLWTLEQIGYDDQRALRLIACRCVRQIWPLLTDERSRNAVEVAERHANGLATDDELSAAWQAAWAASDAASAAARAASSAVRATEAAWSAAGGAAQCRIIREIVPNPFEASI